MKSRKRLDEETTTSDAEKLHHPKQEIVVTKDLTDSRSREVFVQRTCVAEIFGVTTMTLLRWKNSTDIDKHCVNFPIGEKTTIPLYHLKGVLTWAKETNRPTPGYISWANTNPSVVKL